VYQTYSGDNAWVLPMIAEQVDSLWIRVAGRRVLASTLNRSVKKVFGLENWFEVYRDLEVLVPGMVKNFLVACRTAFSADQKKVTVLLRGSKAHSRGGLWHFGFAFWLLRKHGEVRIECYDSGEQNDDQVWATDIGTIRVVRHHGYYNGDGSEFDVVIDDAYSTDDQKPVAWDIKSKIWSKKNHEGGYPFLHQWESRDFSHQIGEGFKPQCPCEVCQLCGRLSVAYSDFLLLRSLCVVYGYGNCGLDITEELKLKAKMLRDLHSQSVTPIVLPGDVRALMCLVREERVKAVSPQLVTLAGLSDKVVTISDFVHKEGLANVEMKGSKVYPWLSGKRVEFVGVNPSVLGETKTLSGPSTKRMGDTIVFGLDFLTVLQGQAPSVMYLPMSRQVTGYVQTGRKVEEYFEYDRLPAVEEQVDSLYSQTMGIKVEGSIGWTQFVPGFYQVTRQQYETLEGAPKMIAPGEGEVKNYLPYRYSIPRKQFIEGKQWYDYVEVHHGKELKWNVYELGNCKSVRLPTKDDQISLVQYKFRGNTLLEVAPNLTTCYYEIREGVVRFSRCNHVHGLKVVNHGKCTEYLEDYYVIVRQGDDWNLMPWHEEAVVRDVGLWENGRFLQRGSQIERGSFLME
jgi:hypothetical protein